MATAPMSPVRSWHPSALLRDVGTPPDDMTTRRIGDITGGPPSLSSGIWPVENVSVDGCEVVLCHGSVRRRQADSGVKMISPRWQVTLSLCQAMNPNLSNGIMEPLGGTDNENKPPSTPAATAQ